MRLSVTTPAGAIVEADIDEVVVPGALGEMGVLPGHVPILAALRPGVLTYKDKGGAKGAVIAVSDGFIEVVPAPGGDRVLVLVTRAEPGASVDRAAAEREVTDLEQELVAWKQAYDGAYFTVRARRDWAQARVDAATRAQSH